MSKTSAETLVEETSSELSAYLRSGKINEEKVSDSLNFDGLDIEDFERLKRIHFVLSELVINFIEDLPERIRRIKTESDRETVSTRGEIKGRIDWSKTLKKRYSQNPADRSIFVTQNPYIQYNIPENLVLKKLLAVIYQTLTEDLKQVDYSWRTDKWSDKDIEELETIFRKNVHVNRIKEAEKINVTARELNAARQARSEIYNDAYRRYREYEKLQNNEFNEEEIGKLLEQTLVVPKEISSLFELFCVFKVIDQLKNQYKGLELQVIESGADEIAVMEDGSKKVKVFHDSQGSLQFKEDIPEADPESLEDGYLKKYVEVLEDHKAALEDLIERTSYNALYSGRPDIVVEIYENKELEQVLIGEIKYTDDEQVFSQGLKELFQYLKFGKHSNQNNNYLDSVNVQGLLITDKVRPESKSWENDVSVKVLNTSDLKNKFSLSILGKSEEK